jgi:hypothetical protein
MKRVMAFKDSADPNMEDNTGPLAGLPPLPSNASKRKLADLTYPPRSPNPKKSFLERHRMMDLEMKGHLEEAMANFSRFQRKYSGGTGGTDPSIMGAAGPKMGASNPVMMSASKPPMLGMNNPSMMGVSTNPSMFGPTESGFTPTGVPVNVSVNATGEKALKKSKKKDKLSKKDKDKQKAKKKKEAAKAKQMSKKSNNDPRKPKRPFSAYNIFFQLEREAILARANQGRDLLKDKIEKEYFKKVESGEVEDEDTPLGPLPPHNPTLHQAVDESAPARYKDLVLEKLWYRAGCKSKRRHRKAEGVSVPFLDLTKMISRRWATIDELAPDIKDYCVKIATKELEWYKNELDKWKIVEKAEMAGNDIDSSSSSGSDNENPQQVPIPPKRKRPKQSPKFDTSLIDLGSQTPNAARESMFDPQFSSRFTDLSRMSGILGTPKDMFANPSTMGPSGGINPGLPPPPLFDDKTGPPTTDTERRIAVMAEAERRFASGNVMNMGGGIGGAGDAIGDRAAALADARRRMQMDMAAMGHSGPMGGLGMPHTMNGMFSGGGMHDRFSNMRRNMMMNQDMFPSGSGGGGDMMNSMMRDRFIDKFSNSDNANSRNEEDFDAEVERFLSTLGKQIKENRKQQSGMGGSAMGGSGSAMQGMSSLGGSAMRNRMMMDEIMNRNRAGNMNLPSFSNFRQQMMGNDNPQLPRQQMMGNDNPQLPEFEGMDPNSRSVNMSPRDR